MPLITQENRRLAVSTPLGDDTLLLTRLNVVEQLSRLPVIELDLQSTEATVDFNALLGMNVTVRLDIPDADPRYFNGYISAFKQTSTAAAFTNFRATVVPWLWFLSRTANCRIFQEQTVPDIIKQVFKDHGFTDVEDRLGKSYRTRDYTVQYRETDFNFVCRLMEDEGIYWFFKHSNGSHKLVLGDSPSSHDTFPGFATIPYRPNRAGETTMDGIQFWSLSKEVQPGVYATTDFDFTRPKKDLLLSDTSAAEHANAHYEIFDYPGGYIETADGRTLAKVRIGEWAAQHEMFHAETELHGIATGYKFTLDDPPFADQEGDYLILGMTLTAKNDAYVAGGASGDLFTCSFTAMKADKHFHPIRLIPKPVIQGPQTAIVVGKKGEEIWTDQYGRVKLQFQWDRYSKGDESSSCWVRVAQIWAGNKWGGMFIPRIGQEVIVEFLEGDPDRPIITGRVYNGDAMPPYDLPDNATVSTVKSNSSKGGDGFNEIRFEDKKGEEQIFIHGEKNQDIRIKNDCFEYIGHDRHLIVKNVQFEHVEVDRHETIDQDHQEHIGRDRHTTIDGKEAKQVGGTLSLKVTGDVAEVFDSNHSEKVSNDYYLKADNIVIEGMTNITIKVGPTYIAIEEDGITIGTPGTGELQSGGPLTIQGAVVKIN